MYSDTPRHLAERYRCVRSAWTLQLDFWRPPTSMRIPHDGKRCARCKRVLPRQNFNRCLTSSDGLQAYCRQCQAAANSLRCRSPRFRQRRRELQRRRRARGSRGWTKTAHRAVAVAIARGVLTRAAACEECGRQGPTQGHHRDYAAPLEVEWLCASCHSRRHLDVRTGPRRNPSLPLFPTSDNAGVAS